MKITDKEMNVLILRIRDESQKLHEILNALEVRHSSIKRQIFCKKHKLNLSQYLKSVNMGRGEAILYPLYMNCVDFIFAKHKKAQKDYLKLRDKVMKILNDLIDKEKAKEQKLSKKNIVKDEEIKNMKNFLKESKRKNEKKDA